jgi:hypothetical protein
MIVLSFQARSHKAKCIVQLFNKSTAAVLQLATVSNATNTALQYMRHALLSPLTHTIQSQSNSGSTGSAQQRRTPCYTTLVSSTVYITD